MTAVTRLSSSFLNYLVSSPVQNGHEPADAPAIPSLSELSKQLGISIASLREQLEVAEALGLVEVRPRTGIRRLPYSFYPAVYQSLSYAIHLDRSYFDAFSELRNQVEASFWDKAVRLLNEQDQHELQELVTQARDKLNGSPIQIPHNEHRQFHLLIYRRLDNPFVQGLLEAYWQAYEEAGLNVYADYQYLQEVWDYHQAMIDAICAGNYDAGYQALSKHIDLLYQRP
jgi:DNA-binding FadR family transcriptional regulator